MNYWQECVSEALEEAGIKASQEQIDQVAEFVSGAHDNYGTMHGHDCIPNPIELENKKLARELAIERDKVACPECCGRGSLTTACGPVRSATSDCWKCRGSGKVNQTPLVNFK
jgi:DnaJ-class molecular chaperone